VARCTTDSTPLILAFSQSASSAREKVEENTARRNLQSQQPAAVLRKVKIYPGSFSPLPYPRPLHWTAPEYFYWAISVLDQFKSALFIERNVFIYICEKLHWLN
jgi:hypothetical protein